MNLKKLLLLASVGGLFLLPQRSFAQETSDQILKQQEQITELEKELNNNQQGQITSQTQEEQVSLALTELENQMAQLTTEKDDLTKKIDKKETLITAMKENATNLASAHSLTTALSVQKKQLKTLKSKFETIELKLEQLETEQANILAEKKQNEQTKVTFENESKKIQDQLEVEKAKLAELEQQKQKEEAQAAALAKTGFLSPLTTALNISSPFGNRVDPTGYSGNQHDGIDFTGNSGDPILAARYGVVIEAGYQASAGNYVILQHDNGYYTYYMHMTSLLVSVGQSVATSEQIGTMGTTGNSTGVHLHFGIATAIWSGFVDPASFIL